MLEIKNITKIYKSKQAEDVIALNNVSINFGDHGLVFLLGKSGSGKSTVLNSIGGLDSFDKGEIIINGRSSSTFSQADFDAYRNTYVGFIFQEYNILPEFSVEKNIALALELQGKNADKQAIETLLETVDMKGYGKRKPNQLSGGQKQRLAIARALVKDPQIILADEPTGALDSKTGKQVFETLKKLGERKLVIVVSHDRENAEYYADRIIELKDGAIISDNTKKKVPPRNASGQVSLIQGNVLHIKSGTGLSAQEHTLIDKMLAMSSGEVFISANPTVNEDIKRTAKIDSNGNSEVYLPTQAADIRRDNVAHECTLIRGHLRTRDAMKMGASSLRAKRGKLVMAIFLSLIAMIVFGFSSTMANFDAGKNMYTSMQNSTNKSFAITKVLNSINYGNDYEYDETAQMTQKDIDYLKSKYSSHTFVAGYNKSINLNYDKLDNLSESAKYNVNNANNGVLITLSELSSLGLSMYAGRLPENASEVAITKLQYEIYKVTGIVQHVVVDGVTKDLSSDVRTTEDVLNKQLDGMYTIVGIVDTKADEQILNTITDKNLDYMTFYTMTSPILQYGIHYVLFYGDKSVFESLSYNNFQFIYANNTASYSYVSVDKRGNDYISNAIMVNSTATALSGNQAIYEIKIRKDYWNSDQYYITDITSDSFATAQDAVDYLENLFSTPDKIQAYFNNSKLSYYGEDDISLSIAGVCYSVVDSWSNNVLHFNPNMPNTGIMQFEKLGDFNLVFSALNGSSADRQLVVNNCKLDTTDDRYLIRNEASGILENFYNVIKVLAQVFFWVGVVFAVFSTLIIMSFISNSISYKKQEIGILRALGASGHDVYRIFTWESLFIAGIIFALAVVLTGIGCFVVNMVMRAQLGLYLSLLSFGILQVLLIGGLCLAIGLISSWLPTRKISRMKPIDAIQNRK